MKDMQQQRKDFYARLVGALLQGLLLGILLCFAILGLLAASSGARIFRYQGF